MSEALRERRRSRRGGGPRLSPSLLRPAIAPNMIETTPPGSPTILGPAEAPLLPEEDDDDDEWEDGPLPLASAPVRAPAARAPAPASAVSPSLRRRAPAGAGMSAQLSPSLFEGVVKAPPPPGTRLVRIKDRVVPFTRSPFKRASRAARPNEPSPGVLEVCTRLAKQTEAELKKHGRTKCPVDDHVRHRSSGSGGKGPSVHAQNAIEQAKMNHILSLKAKNVDAHNQTWSWLLWGNTADQCYDLLAESALRANAVNSGIVKRKETQGANYQTTRINCKGMGQAAATQCVNAAIAMAMAEATLRSRGVHVRKPLATNAVDPCLFAGALNDPRNDELVGVVSTTQLVYNANPTKLGRDCILTAAKKLARLELTVEAISERMASANYMLTAMCKSVGGGYEIDAAWASIVLIVYLCSDPRGRPLLREQTELTDLDIQTACAFEAYGRGEVTRRARLKESASGNDAATRAKRQRAAAAPGPSGPPLSADDLAEAFEQVDATLPETQDGIVVEDDTASIVNDDEEDDCDADGNLDADAQHAARADQKVLATKRKRASKGNASASTSDAHGILTWWFKALRCKDMSVLGTLVSYTKSAAREAAQATLATQAEGTNIAESRVISQMSAENAVRSSQALHPFIYRKPEDTPEWVGVSIADGSQPHACAPWQPGVCIGLARVPNAARSAAIHACARPPAELRPPRAARLSVLHSVAVQEFRPRSEHAPTAPGVFERYRKIASIRADDRVARGHQKPKLSAVEIARVGKLENYVAAECERALPSAASGVTRSFVAMETVFFVHEQTFASARVLVDEGERLQAKLAAMRVETRETELLTAQLMARGVRTPVRSEPFCLPAPALAVGLRMNGLLQSMMKGRSRKNEPCKVLLGVHSSAEVARETPLVSDMEPLPLASITDFDVRFAPGNLTGGGAGAGAGAGAPSARLHERPAKVALHVGIDAAVRVPEVVARLTDIHQQRAVLYTAASQASRIGELGATVSAAAANANIAGSKKINVRRHSNLHLSNSLTSLVPPRWQCADVNTLPCLSAFNAYVGGITNVQRSFQGTPYSGAYGPPVDSGITCSGLLAHYYRSDNRGHGSMTLSQACADECAAVFAQHHHVPIGKKQYAARPIGTRGVPHGLVPGVHAALDDLVEALAEHTRQHAIESAPWTVQGVFVVPLSGATQALRPDVESTADSTIRTCVRDPTDNSCATGRSYLPDATCEEAAIFAEPLWRRPCQASVGDNPFASAYEYADSLWNLMNTLTIIAERVGGVVALRQLITEFHRSPEEHAASAGRRDYLWALDACVLIFGALYPRDHRIAKPVVPDCYAQAHAALNRETNARLVGEDEAAQSGSPLCALLPGAAGRMLWEEARALWARFSTRPASLCPWCVGVAPMLELLRRHNGAYALTREDVAEHRERVNTLASRAAWLAYSEDGTHAPSAPNPAAGCATMHDVRRPTLDPVFVAQGEGLEIEPRGGLVALKGYQLREIYALLMGSHLLPERGADGPPHPGVQVYRNEGGLELRVSSKPTVLERDGTKRSPKAIAPTQTESDQAAYGTRKAKCYGADLQAAAWDANVRVLMPLYVQLSEPRPKEWREAGGFGEPSWVRAYIAQEQERMAHVVHADERWARRRLEQAASSSLSYQMNAGLRRA